MKRKIDIVTKDTVSIDTRKSAREVSRILDKAEQLKSDPEKRKRLEKSLCLSCFYINFASFGGAAITERPCGICEDNMSFPTTVVDKVCNPCASKNDLCKRCGADLNLEEKDGAFQLK